MPPTSKRFFVGNLKFSAERSFSMDGSLRTARSKAHPFFLAQIEGAGLGWFDAIYDERGAEEVLIQQNTTASAIPFVWTSFNKRSEARDPLAPTRDDNRCSKIFLSALTVSLS